MMEASDFREAFQRWDDFVKVQPGGPVEDDVVERFYQSLGLDKDARRAFQSQLDQQLFETGKPGVMGAAHFGLLIGLIARQLADERNSS